MCGLEIRRGRDRDRVEEDRDECNKRLDGGGGWTRGQDTGGEGLEGLDQ